MCNARNEAMGGLDWEGLGLDFFISFIRSFAMRRGL